jgi:hypothetical protein
VIGLTGQILQEKFKRTIIPSTKSKGNISRVLLRLWAQKPLWIELSLRGFWTLLNLWKNMSLKKEGETWNKQRILFFSPADYFDASYNGSERKFSSNDAWSSDLFRNARWIKSLGGPKVPASHTQVDLIDTSRKMETRRCENVVWDCSGSLGEIGYRVRDENRWKGIMMVRYGYSAAVSAQQGTLSGKHPPTV